MDVGLQPLSAPDVIARQELARLAPTILARIIGIVFIGEFAVMLILEWLEVSWGVWTALLDTFLLTLLLAAPLYLLVFRPIAQLTARAVAAPLQQRLQLFESLLPACAVCGKVRDDSKTERGQGAWRSLQEYVMEHTDTRLSHGFCPDCYHEYRRKAGLPEKPYPPGRS